MSVRLQIRTRDRVGMALDVLKILYSYGINLKALEVRPGFVYVKMDEEFSGDLDTVIRHLSKEKDVYEVSIIRLLPQEKREKQIKAVLDAKETPANALKVAHYLEAYPLIEKVHYPGLTCHPQHELAKGQMHGFGGMISFGLVGGIDAGKTLMNSVKMISLAVSLGCVDSLIQQ